MCVYIYYAFLYVRQLIARIDRHQASIYTRHPSTPTHRQVSYPLVTRGSSNNRGTRGQSLLRRSDEEELRERRGRAERQNRRTLARRAPDDASTPSQGSGSGDPVSAASSPAQGHIAGTPSGPYPTPGLAPLYPIYNRFRKNTRLKRPVQLRVTPPPSPPPIHPPAIRHIHSNPTAQLTQRPTRPISPHHTYTGTQNTTCSHVRCNVEAGSNRTGPQGPHSANVQGWRGAEEPRQVTWL